MLLNEVKIDCLIREWRLTLIICIKWSSHLIILGQYETIKSYQKVGTTWKIKANHLAYIGGQIQQFALNRKVTTFSCEKPWSVTLVENNWFRKWLGVVQVLVL